MKKHTRFSVGGKAQPETPAIRAIATKMLSDKIKALDTWLRSLGVTEENIREYTINAKVHTDGTFDYEVKKGETLLGKKTI